MREPVEDYSHPQDLRESDMGRMPMQLRFNLVMSGFAGFRVGAASRAALAGAAGESVLRTEVRLGSTDLLDDLPDHLSLHKCQPLVAPQMRVRQLILLQPKLMQDRRVNVAEVHGILDGV